MALDERYRWTFTVQDAFGWDKTLAIGVDDGRPIMNCPPWWTADTDTADRIAAAWQAASDAARQPRRS